MPEHLRKALEQINKEIELQTAIINAASAKLAQLQATKIGLQNALGQQEQAEIAWTDLVRAVLNNYPVGHRISAVEVRDVLKSWGYNFQGVTNPLALINTCLQRLFASGEIAREGGRPFRFGRR